MMKIRDIVNRDIVNLTNCEHEPIHIPGSIQPHGFLIAVNEKGMIDYCSSNVLEHTGISHEQLLGRSLAAIFGNGSLMVQQFDMPAMTPATPFAVSFEGIGFSCFTHKNGQDFIAEFEPAESHPLELGELYNLNLQSINALQTADTLKKLCHNIAGQVRKLTGYDRVMIYRFDEQYNGEVFAESCEENLEPFLGLHYPHTDIPAQARQLYIRNLLRVIVDVAYTPVPIYTINDTPGKNLDLSMTALRSVSPIHIEYLQNMGVRATLTISLLHEGKLWGLVACHHYQSEKYLSAYTRVSAQLLGHLLTSQIKVREVAEEYELARKVTAALEKILNTAHAHDRNSFAAIVEQPEIVQLCQATGVAIVFGKQVYAAGKTPTGASIRDMARQVKPLSVQGAYHTNRLISDYAAAKNICDTASGLICHFMEGSEEDCIMWFRTETLEEVHWAGDPEKAIVKNEKGLSPRNSFERWREIIKCSSNPWARPELTAAATYANTLQKHVHLLFLSEEEFKYRQLSERLREANVELENINWISTHDLKEPLRKIQVFSSRILSREKEELSELVVNSLERMNESANRMQKLITDITSYSRLRHNRDLHLDVDLNEVLNDIRDDLQNELAEVEGTIDADPLPMIKGIRLLLTQLFLNLVRNSIKFRKKEIAPVIEIGYQSGQLYTQDETQTKFHKITVTDNGIGFDNQHKENVFKVFTRLHNQDDYAGSGIGLALCKQVVHIHGGYIDVDGRPGEGASFSLYFPM
ncbi:ATP-binding protein [Sediminibacterium soli]|uniref:ATP-binding protein n=1 Tax=Sediminibacterium soli TaxID=2698829 RepID=UPI00137A9E2E|nr:ATP-binding protein [Sediminibacterium soli]NCI47248.1 GAF domain-containing protein [Sediminibacterium soli]